jgi:hypothetical protein
MDIFEHSERAAADFHSEAIKGVGQFDAIEALRIK